MDAHFDPNQFHPTFLNSTPDDISRAFHNISMDSFCAQAYEHCLAPEVVTDAVEHAYSFFGMTPGWVIGGDVTAMNYGNPTTYADDVMTINRNELLSHGIHDKSTLSLICTHELTHAVTQNLYSTGEITTWQSELISDKFMGFRAAIEGLDLGGVLESFDGENDSPSHPGEDLRDRHIMEAYVAAKKMMEEGIPCDFQTLLGVATDQINADPSIATREQAAVASVGSSLSMYTKSEIDSHIREQQDKIDYLKNLIQRKERERDEQIRNGKPHSSADYTIGSAKVDLENAKKSLENWRNTKPS